MALAKWASSGQTRGITTGRHRPMINIIGWIVIGFLSGLLARFFYPGAIEMGWISTTLLGIAGSFAGGFIGGMFTKEKDMMKPSPAGFIMSVIGAIAVIFIARTLGIPLNF
ncbi:MAG: GlsB/YeaQ/YmgE family stress response membrane protein [Sphingomonadaceae bacterium]